MILPGMPLVDQAGAVRKGPKSSMDGDKITATMFLFNSLMKYLALLERMGINKLSSLS